MSVHLFFHSFLRYLDLLCDAFQFCILAVLVLFGQLTVLQQKSYEIFQSSIGVLLLDHIDADDQSNTVNMGL